MVKVIPNGIFHQSTGFYCRKPVFGLPNKFRLTNEHREHGARRSDNIIGCNLRCLLVASHVAVGLDALVQSGAQTRNVGAPLRRVNSITIGIGKAVRSAKPRNGPFNAAVCAIAFYFARERLIGHGRQAFGCCL